MIINQDRLGTNIGKRGVEKQEAFFLQGTSAFAEITIGSTSDSAIIVKLVLLPASFADRVFKIADRGGHVLIADDGGAASGLLQTQLLLQELPSGEVHVRTALGSTEVWACPPLPATTNAATTDGVFEKYTLDTPQPKIPVPTATLVTPAGPARTIPMSPHHKAQEPTMEDWDAAAIYSVKLSLPDGARTTSTTSIGRFHLNSLLAVCFRFALFQTVLFSFGSFWRSAWADTRVLRWVCCLPFQLIGCICTFVPACIRTLLLSVRAVCLCSQRTF